MNQLQLRGHCQGGCHGNAGDPSEVTSDFYGVKKQKAAFVTLQKPNTLLKPKRHSHHRHGFVVHALLLRMHTNVVYFRVMRRLCCRE